MTDLTVMSQKSPLNGVIRVPGDKSISHRVVILAALADGDSVIRRWLPAGDTLATLEIMRALGVNVSVDKRSSWAWDLAVEGRGLKGLSPPAGALDCRNAGTCMRLMAGILAGQPFPTTLDGSPQLRKRPMGRIVEPLHQMGAQISAQGGRPPLAIEPATLEGITYRLPVASAQVKSAVLLAGLYARGETRIEQPGPARDHTERLLQAMGAPIEAGDRWISFNPVNPWQAEIQRSESKGDIQRSLAPLDLTVPGDISSAAFPLVAAAIVPHSQVTIEGVGMNDTRTGLLDILAAMGARLGSENIRFTGGEPAADLTAVFEELHPNRVQGTLVVRAIDEFPIWAVAATQAAGASELREAAELRVKEVDRISLLTQELRKTGAQIEEHPDGMTVMGPTRLRGAEVDSHGDHRLGMALAIAGLVANSPTIIHNADCIADSFPSFVEIMQSLGATIHWQAG